MDQTVNFYVAYKPMAETRYGQDAHPGFPPLKSNGYITKPIRTAYIPTADLFPRRDHSFALVNIGVVQINFFNRRGLSASNIDAAVAV